MKKKVEWISKKEDGTIDWKTLILGKDTKIFFFFIMVMFLSYAYAHDTKECKAMLENIEQICIEYNTIATIQNNQAKPIYNIGDLDLGGVINDSTRENNQSGGTGYLSANS